MILIHHLNTKHSSRLDRKLFTGTLKLEKMNILVTGANGQLGNEMRRVAARSSDRYIFTDVAELDITNNESVKEMVQREKLT